MTITAILTLYRRPQTLHRQLAAIRGQSMPATQIWAWANEPGAQLRAMLESAGIDRVVSASRNSYFHGRFALALLAATDYVAVFDDDTIPGEKWFENCLVTMARSPGILGTAGVVLNGPSYGDRRMLGWQHPSNETVAVDLVGQAWFLRTEWVHYLFAQPAVTGTNGEDIELAARAARLGGVDSYCPPHPADDRSRWGSTCGFELGMDEVATSWRAEHAAQRDRIVEAELKRGWRPLFMRGRARGAASGESSGAADDVQSADGYGERAKPNAQVALVAKADSGTKFDQDLLSLVPARAQSVLALGSGNTERVFQVARCGPDWNELSATGPLVSSFDEELDLDSCRQDASGQVDCIICDGGLSKVASPDIFIRRLRSWLAPDGVLIASIANVRHHERLTSLLHGRWHGGAKSADAIRFFTRRELEKLFYRAGFDIEELTARGTAGLEAWRARGSPAVVKAGPLGITVATKEDAEEFYAEEYLLRAKPAVKADLGLTSIVILTHNQLDYTRACLESIRFRTDEPYELIVVDNASTDGTVDYLRSQQDVQLIENQENRGFPTGCNQGIRASRGQQVLLLNNDVVVTTGWLDRMLRALRSDPRIGLAGPTSNSVSGPQCVPATYHDLSSLDGFAWEWAKKNAGQVEDTDRLVGFCLLIRRSVIESIGDLDERFGIGNFEDDDYSLRAIDAGYRAVIARDSFIHHFGGQTFKNSDVDFHELLKRNERLFREKWHGRKPPEGPLAPGARANGDGAEGVAGPSSCGQALIEPTEDAHRVTPQPVTTRTFPLSLCMIVRDNERTIGPCLASIKPWVDEMVVVDTGSRDRTPQIARDLGARLYHFPWCDSFAAARNESLKYARGAWIFWMDSDDVIDEANGRQLRALACGTAPGKCAGLRDESPVPKWWS